MASADAFAPPPSDAVLRPRPRSRRLGAAAPIVVPVLIVAAVLAGAVGTLLHAYGANVTEFVQFGRAFAGVTHPPPGARLISPIGYDGQFFYLQATDPLLLHPATIAALRPSHQVFRAQRMAYPALASLLSGGRRGAIPYALLGINLGVVLAVAGGFAVYARRRGWSSLWAVALAVMPGMLLPVLRDLSDPLATATLLAGLLAWRERRRAPAAAALAVCVLTREVMIVVPLALAVEAALRAWRARSASGSDRSARAVIARSWPPVLIPALAFAAWQIYVDARYGGIPGTAPAQPLLNLLAEARIAIHTGMPVYAAWDCTYLALIAAGCLAAYASLRRGPTVLHLAAAALTAGVLLPSFGDAWSDTRLAAPLFAVLLVIGLLERDRWALRIAGTAAGMSLLVPFAFPGIL